MKNGQKQEIGSVKFGGSSQPIGKLEQCANWQTSPGKPAEWLLIDQEGQYFLSTRRSQKRLSLADTVAWHVSLEKRQDAHQGDLSWFVDQHHLWLETIEETLRRSEQSRASRVVHSYYSVEQVAAGICVGKEWVMEKVKAGEFDDPTVEDVKQDPSVAKVGGQIMIAHFALERFLKRRVTRN